MTLLIKVIFLGLLSSSVLADTQTNKKVVFIGDSHTVGCFGQEIFDQLQTQTSVSQIKVAASCGSSVAHWFQPSNTGACTPARLRDCTYYKESGTNTCNKSVKNVPGLDVLFKDHNPSITIVALGANMVGKGKWSSSAESHVKKMIAKIKEQNSQCIWIGPPNERNKPDKNNDFVKNLKLVVEKNGCVFINSKDHAPTDPEAYQDRLHYKCDAGKKWGKSVYSEIKKSLSVNAEPIKKAEEKLRPEFEQIRRGKVKVIDPNTTESVIINSNTVD